MNRNMLLLIHTNYTQLPKLPLPSLENSCAQYLRAVRPLVTPREYEATKAAVELFLNSGEGSALHNELQERNEHTTTSWFKPFWDDAYLCDREPSVINVNPFFLIQDDPNSARNCNQAARAASLVAALVRWYRTFRSGGISPDKERDQPLCMYQYTQLFGSTRIPQPERDERVQCPDSVHIVVICCNQFYSFDVFDRPASESSQAWKDVGMLSDTDIELNIRYILKDARKHTLQARGFPVGVLTTEKRDEWARLRSVLVEHSAVNKEALDAIDKALFVLCLDEVVPLNDEQVSQVMLHGDGRNRWFDKTLQLIVCANGKSGINMEHSAIDGHTMLRLLTDVFLDSVRSVIGPQPSLALGRPTPHKMQWFLPAPILSAIDAAGPKIDTLIAQMETKVIEFTDFGKDFIVAHKLSPDAFVQMAFQLAYYRQFGCIASTYESVMTKKFAYGRTEPLRSSSSEALAFVRAFSAGHAPNDAKFDTLRAAVTAHVRTLENHKQGQGFERHLQAIRWLSMEKKQKMPAMFTDPSWNVLTSSVLSTSNCGGKALILFGFGPVVDNGFGIGYMIKNDRLIMNITSRHRRTGQLCACLQQSLLDMRVCVESTQRSSSRL